MSANAGKYHLTDYDDLFGVSAANNGTASGVESVQNIPLTELFPFPNHPFKVRDDEDMAKTVDSVKEYGVLNPAIVRPQNGGGYQLVSGHRRKRACEIAGIMEMPVIIRNLTDDEAAIIMVDSNIVNREKVDLCDLGKAYKIKLAALKNQGKRTDLTSDPLEQKLGARDAIAKDAGESPAQIQRYIRLTELIDDFQVKVDEGKIGFRPAVELSYLNQNEQILLLDAMDSEQAIPSLAQAQRLKKFSQEGTLSIDVMRAIMSEEKKPVASDIKLSGNKVNKYFPKSYTIEQKEALIEKLLAQWHKKRLEATR